jgi:class 3 adenylate cyclase/tetratricopeptide (TPR) repeat protein
MRCLKCQADNREERRFCIECGAPLPVLCPACRFANEPGGKFCGGCGAALPTVAAVGEGRGDSTDNMASVASSRPESVQPRGSSEAERRQLTVMFCDLAGSTALSAQLDPEVLRDVIRSFQEASVKVIDRFEGFVARYMGDGILVHFGYPHAHEDDAERAVRAGLGIIEGVAEIDAPVVREIGVALAVRIGIATGIVVAGDLIGEGAAEEKAVVGETPNLAARLQSLATPNSVVISATTRTLLRGLFEYEDLGPRQLKGFSESVRAYRVVRPRETRSRFEAAHEAGLTPFADRDEESELLRRRWEQAKEGEGQVVLLSGEAGIGKSRITQVLRDDISNDPHYRLRYQCSPYYTNTALYPFITQLKLAAKIHQADTVEQKLDKLEALLAMAQDRVENDVPLIAWLLSIPSHSRYAPLDMSPEQQKAQTLAALLQQLSGLSARQPVLTIVEDTHWMDPSSLELLNLLVERAQVTQVLAVITFRPDFSPPWLERSHVTLISLNRLNQRQTAAMVMRVTGGKAFPPEVVEQVVSKTDGVPLFVEEITKTIQESRLLDEEADRYVLRGPLPPLAIPATLQDSLVARLVQLTPVKAVAQTAAAIGREFSYELLAEVCGLHHAELQAALEQLTRSELVYRRGTPPATTYIFKHALVQDAAYETLLRSTRRQLHARIAQALSERFPERAELEPELLAHHYSQAGLAEQAATYWGRAAERALYRSANLEAVGHVTNALAHLAKLAETADRDRQELAFQIVLGAAYRATKGFASSEAERSFVRARELCERVGGTRQLIDALRGLYACYYIRGQLPTARRQAEQVLALGQRTQDSSILMVGHWMVGCVMFWQGQFPEGRRELEEAVALYDPSEQREKTLAAQIDPEVSALIHLGWTLWILGYPEQALRTSEEAIAAARKLAQPFASRAKP